MADLKKPPPVLFKNRSWTPDIHRNIEWEMLKIKQRRRYSHRRSKSIDTVSEFDVTDDDMKELRGCIELGFGFDPSNDLDPNLFRAFPALELYVAVNRQFNNNRNLSRSSSIDSDSSFNSNASSSFIVDPNDDPEKVKMRLRRWAQVVACSIHEASRSCRIGIDD